MKVFKFENKKRKNFDVKTFSDGCYVVYSRGSKLFLWVSQPVVVDSTHQENHYNRWAALWMC